MTIFFTSDTHFSHANIIKYCNRPFADKHEMNEQLIANWNSTVKHDDLVYHLGDVAFCKLDQAKEILQRLNGRLILVLGNHDRQLKADALATKLDGRLEAVHSQRTIIDIDGQQVKLSHYPESDTTWFSTGGWMLHGHCHGTAPKHQHKMLDVGVDVFGFKPVAFEKIAELLQ
jgi:calcineurin-like phosphoesterase family protein